MSGRTATRYCGIGAIHNLIQKIGLPRLIDENLNLLKRRQPYFESDHVLNLAYNLLAGNNHLQGIEHLRNDSGYLNMLGAERIPDPTTAGDFTRRFSAEKVELLIDIINSARVRVWNNMPARFRESAIIDVDGTIVPSEGQKKMGIGLSHKGIWGYAPLIISMEKTREVLYIVNRSGNERSQSGADYWIDRAIDLCSETFEDILLRGDTDFSLTWKFDEWTERGARFVFGYKAYKNVVALADGLPENEWRPLSRNVRKTGKPRRKRPNYREQFVKEKGYENLRLHDEEIAEFPYSPTSCREKYRMIVLRKNITRMKGENALFDEIRYFFYITNDTDMSAEEVVRHSNKRCDQENIIEQLKNGVGALRVPMYDLVSNWAYMVIASLAWNLKTWFILNLPSTYNRDSLLRLDFERFLADYILIPCEVTRSGRTTRLRIMMYTEGIRHLFASNDALPRSRYLCPQ